MRDEIVISQPLTTDVLALAGRDDEEVGFARPFLLRLEKEAFVKNTNTDGIFKSEKKNPSDRMDQATLASRAILDQEAAARQKKTARLRELRLRQEAAEAANPAAEASKKRRTQKRK